MSLYRAIIIAVLFGVPLFFAFASAQESGSDSELSFIYAFHLYYDKGTLVADRDFEFPYDVVSEEFTGSSGPFRFEVINKLGEVAFTDPFDPKGGNTQFAQGKITVKVPYFSDGSKVIFYDDKGVALLTLDVHESSFCDDNGTCDEGRGESERSCPHDCSSTKPNSSGNRDRNSSWLWIVLGLGALIGLIVYGVQRLRSRGGGLNNPPPMGSEGQMYYNKKQ